MQRGKSTPFPVKRLAFRTIKICLRKHDFCREIAGRCELANLEKAVLVLARLKPDFVAAVLWQIQDRKRQ
jgi:hypothetical protein